MYTKFVVLTILRNLQFFILLVLSQFIAIGQAI
jgi:hypothetical protein